MCGAIVVAMEGQVVVVLGVRMLVLSTQIVIGQKTEEGLVAICLRVFLEVPKECWQFQELVQFCHRANVCPE